MASQLDRSDDEVVVADAGIRIFAGPDTGLEEDALEDVRNETVERLEEALTDTLRQFRDSLPVGFRIGVEVQ